MGGVAVVTTDAKNDRTLLVHGVPPTRAGTGIVGVDGSTGGVATLQLPVVGVVTLDHAGDEAVIDGRVVGVDAVRVVV